MALHCDHDTFEVSPRFNAIEGPEPFYFAELRVRCSSCKTPFHWRGVQSGQPNPIEPMVTADGYVLFAPVAPGPGAIVGLLNATGLGDRLVDPNANGTN